MFEKLQQQRDALTRLARIYFVDTTTYKLIILTLWAIEQMLALPDNLTPEERNTLLRFTVTADGFIEALNAVENEVTK